MCEKIRMVLIAFRFLLQLAGSHFVLGKLWERTEPNSKHWMLRTQSLCLLLPEVKGPEGATGSPGHHSRLEGAHCYRQCPATPQRMASWSRWEISFSMPSSILQAFLWTSALCWNWESRLFAGFMPVTNHDLKLHTGNKASTRLPTGKATGRMKESREGYVFSFCWG